eukprot:tig00020553_g10521.t1
MQVASTVGATRPQPASPALQVLGGDLTVAIVKRGKLDPVSAIRLSHVCPEARRRLAGTLRRWLRNRLLATAALLRESREPLRSTEARTMRWALHDRLAARLLADDLDLGEMAQLSLVQRRMLARAHAAGRASTARLHRFSWGLPRVLVAGLDEDLQRELRARIASAARGEGAFGSGPRGVSKELVTPREWEMYAESVGLASPLYASYRAILRTIAKYRRFDSLRWLVDVTDGSMCEFFVEQIDAHTRIPWDDLQDTIGGDYVSRLGYLEA